MEVKILWITKYKIIKKGKKQNRVLPKRDGEVGKTE
jgi:hypothetical protein